MGASVDDGEGRQRIGEEGGVAGRDPGDWRLIGRDHPGQDREWVRRMENVEGHLVRSGTGEGMGHRPGGRHRDHRGPVTKIPPVAGIRRQGRPARLGHRERRRLGSDHRGIDVNGELDHVDPLEGQPRFPGAASLEHPETDAEVHRQRAAAGPLRRDVEEGAGSPQIDVRQPSGTGPLVHVGALEPIRAHGQGALRREPVLRHRVPDPGRVAHHEDGIGADVTVRLGVDHVPGADVADRPDGGVRLRLGRRQKSLLESRIGGVPQGRAHVLMGVGNGIDDRRVVGVMVRRHPGRSPPEPIRAEDRRVVDSEIRAAWRPLRHQHHPDMLAVGQQQRRRVLLPHQRVVERIPHPAHVPRGIGRVVGGDPGPGLGADPRREVLTQAGREHDVAGVARRNAEGPAVGVVDALAHDRVGAVGRDHHSGVVPGGDRGREVGELEGVHPEPEGRDVRDGGHLVERGIRRRDRKHRQGEGIADLAARRGRPADGGVKVPVEQPGGDG